MAYLSFNTHQLLEGYFAAPLIRAIVMPLNVRLTAAGVHLHPQSRRTARRGLRGRFRAPRGTACASPAPASSAGWNRATPYEELVSRGRIQRPDIFTFDENEIAELFYTSGSTGTPKGVTLSHRTLYLHMLGISATFYN